METIKLCKCGCGRPAPIAYKTSKRDGYKKGDSKRFIRGHQRGMPKYIIIPDGIRFCKCGCGEQVHGISNGRLVMFKMGHYAKFINNPHKFVTYEEKFWSKVDIHGEDECWEWKECKNNGYGSVRYQGKMHPAHRVAFILAGGVLTQRNKFTCHHCDNPSCCNPKHLFAGNADINNKDRAAKGRSGNNKGEKNNSAKITEEQVLEIRHIRKTNNISYKDIGNLYGLKSSQILRICHRESWVHIP